MPERVIIYASLGLRSGTSELLWAFRKKNTLEEFPVYLDEGGWSAVAYGVTGVPETYIVDKKGILREKVIGPADWNSPQAISAVATPLQE